MEASKIDGLMITLVDNLKPEHAIHVREILQSVPDEKFAQIQLFPYKKPIIALILSLFLGGLGIDRMYAGNIGLGVLKLVTCGGLGIWSIVDWFLIMGITKEKNYQDLMDILR